MHFTINWREHCELQPMRWLVTSTNTDQPMITLLAMALGEMSAIHTRNPLEGISVERVVQGHEDYLDVDGVLDAICALRDGARADGRPKRIARGWTNSKRCASSS